MSEYFKVDSRKVGYMEYWRIVDGKISLFMVAAIAKFLRIPLNFNSAIPRFETLTFLDAGDVPENVRQAIIPMIETIRAQKAELQFFYKLPMLSLNTDLAASFLTADGKSMPQILYSRSGEIVTNSFSCVTKLSDGTLIVTTDQKRKFDPVPWSQSNFIPGAGVPEILSKHASRLMELTGPQPVILTSDSVAQFIVDLNVRLVEHEVARGRYVPMRPDEVEALREKSMSGQAPV
jgi:hypothetical protein